MSERSDIPEELLVEAERLTGSHRTYSRLVTEIAKSLMAERTAQQERDAKIAEERAAICADAVAKIEAGELYQGIATAKATEDCARLEALHIACLIRGEPGAIRKGTT